MVNRGCIHAGDLTEYVIEEINVRVLSTCSDPLKYATIQAEPDWQVCSTVKLNSMWWSAARL